MTPASSLPALPADEAAAAAQGLSIIVPVYNEAAGLEQLHERLGALAAFLFGLSILWETLVDGESVPGYPSLVVGIMTLGGVQLLMIGIMGEYIGKILSELKARPIYFVAEHSVKQAGSEPSAGDPPRTAAE